MQPIFQRIALLAFSALVLGPGMPTSVAAVPPAGTVAGAATLPRAQKVKHRVLQGERLSEIAARYAVRVESLVRWNKLDKKRPRIRAGQRLKVWTHLEVPERQRIIYIIERGDNWTKIAKRHDVNVKHLRRRWNRKVKGLRAGGKLLIWVEASPTTLPDQGGKALAPGLPVVAVPPTAISIGSPSRGRLQRGIRLPDNPDLYTIRRPDNSWGSSHTITVLQRALSDYRRSTGFDRQLVVADISRRHGGRFRPHHSHRSGRDVDIRLPLKRGVKRGTIPRRTSQVDWGQSWHLIKALIDTGQVKYIFLSRNRQRALRTAALREGASRKEVDRLIQFPGRE